MSTRRGRSYASRRRAACARPVGPAARATRNADAVLAAALTAGVTARRLGTTGGDKIAGVALSALRTAHEAFFPALMRGEPTIA